MCSADEIRRPCCTGSRLHAARISQAGGLDRILGTRKLNLKLETAALPKEQKNRRLR